MRRPGGSIWRFGWEDPVAWVENLEVLETKGLTQLAKPASQLAPDASALTSINLLTTSGSSNSSWPQTDGTTLGIVCLHERPAPAPVPASAPEDSHKKPLAFLCRVHSR